MERFIPTLSGLTADENTAVTDAGINNAEDLSAVTYEDISVVPDQASIVKRRKLSHVESYLARGQTIDAAATMPMIVTYLNTPIPINQAPQQQTTYPPDPARGALRLYVNSIEKYSGSPIDFEDWELKTRATLGQTAYANLLTNAPVVGDILQEARNKELYNMFITALMNGAGMHILNGVINQDGHAAWMAINTWHGSAATSRTIIRILKLRKSEGVCTPTVRK